VKVIHFNDKENPQFSDLLKEYKYASSRISYERIDPNQRPEMVRQYKVRQMGDTVVSIGDRNESISGITEQGVTNAIVKITRDSVKTICFSEGHGEKSISDTQAMGYSSVDERLKNESYQHKTVLLAREKQVPSECAALVVAGPQDSVTPDEAAMIGKYLDEGGKAMLLLDPETDPKLGDVLKSWGIQADNNVVLDFTQFHRNGGPGAPIVTDYDDHTITRDFGSTYTAFPMARAIKVSSGAGVNVTALLKTSDGGYAKDKITPGQDPSYEAGKDQKGPLTLGAAASKMVNGKEARLVVIGDSDFASNGALEFKRNADLFLNSVNWLVGNEDLISIRPKSASNRSVAMSESQQRTFFWLSVLFMPLAVIGSGIYIWWKRR
jgi:ABC-type uncharacterized transport system involved in gliding motility auxiliary subunit